MSVFRNFRLLVMERLAKGRITIKIVNLLRYVMYVLSIFFTLLLMDIDRHDCEKYNKYRASNRKFLIVVTLVVNKIVICE